MPGVTIFADLGVLDGPRLCEDFRQALQGFLHDHFGMRWGAVMFKLKRVDHFHSQSQQRLVSSR